MKLNEAIAANRLKQRLVSDPTLRLGELLKLPTFRAGAGAAYERRRSSSSPARSARSSIRCPLPAVTPGRSSATWSGGNRTMTAGQIQRLEEHQPRYSSSLDSGLAILQTFNGSRCSASPTSPMRSG